MCGLFSVVATEIQRTEKVIIQDIVDSFSDVGAYVNYFLDIDIYKNRL